jgi:hypothetical protein
VADLLAPEWGRDPRDSRLDADAYAAAVHRDLARAGLTPGGADGGARADLTPGAGHDMPAS